MQVECRTSVGKENALKFGLIIGRGDWWSRLVCLFFSPGGTTERIKGLGQSIDEVSVRGVTPLHLWVGLVDNMLTELLVMGGSGMYHRIEQPENDRRRVLAVLRNMLGERHKSRYGELAMCVQNCGRVVRQSFSRSNDGVGRFDNPLREAARVSLVLIQNLTGLSI